MKTNEVKNVTCAVRLDKPLYDRLVEVSEKSHKTLSEIIRAGILNELELRRKELMHKELEMTELENELNQVRKLKGQMEELLLRQKA
jgi:hypothetical protein